jgi:hypothetical protein
VFQPGEPCSGSASRRVPSNWCFMSLFAAKRFLGLMPYKYAYSCDRCRRCMGRHPDCRLCPKCAAIPPSEIRRHALRYFELSKCALCGTNIDSRASFLDVCNGCAARHIDETHSSWSLTSIHLISYLWRHCRSCGSIRFLRQENGMISYEYLHAGSKFRSPDSDLCHEGLRKAFLRPRCAHDFMLIEDALRPFEAGLRRYQEDLVAWQSGEEPYSFIADMIDDQTMRLMAFGSRTYWCCKCGFLKQNIPQVHSESRVIFDDRL